MVYNSGATKLIIQTINRIVFFYLKSLLFYHSQLIMAILIETKTENTKYSPFLFQLKVLLVVMFY